MYQIVSFCLLFLSQLLINNLRSLSILQVASAFVYRLQNGGDFPRYVESLGQCLLYYLKLKKADIHIMLVRRHCQEVIWHLWWAYFLLIGERKKRKSTIPTFYAVSFSLTLLTQFICYKPFCDASGYLSFSLACKIHFVPNI